MKKNNFFYRFRVFLLVFLFIFPCFAFLACDGGDGGGGGSFDFPSFTDPTEKGMVELTPNDGIILKYLYKPDDLSPYYDRIKEGIYNSAENTLVNLVGEYGIDNVVAVYNDEYIDVEPETTSLSPFEPTSSETLKRLFNNVAVGASVRKLLSRCEFAHHDRDVGWYAIGTKDIPENLISFSDGKFKLNTSGGAIADISDVGSSQEVTESGMELEEIVYSYNKAGNYTYIWVGSAAQVVVSEGTSKFTKMLLDTHYNAIDRTITSVEGEVGAITITKQVWAWRLDEWEEGDTPTYLEAYLQEYKNKLAINIAKIIAYGNGEISDGTIKHRFNDANQNPNVKAEEWIDHCITRIDHIGVSADEADLIAEFIYDNVIGQDCTEAENWSYSGGGDSDKFYANEISEDNVKRILGTVDEETGEFTFNGKIVVDETSASGSVENGFRRIMPFKNYYNTARASLERTRLVFPEIPIVDYVDIAYNQSDDDMIDISHEEPANGKIQSVVITNLNGRDLQIASMSFIISSIYDESNSNWTIDTLDIYIYANYCHNGELKQFSLDTLFLSTDNPSDENGIPDEYGPLDEKTYNIWDPDNSPALNGEKIILSQNTHTELDTEDWGGLKDGNADSFDRKNSIEDNTFKNFKSVNYGFGNSAAYNGGGDYLEICFVVSGESASLLDFYNYSITVSALFGKQV